MIKHLSFESTVPDNFYSEQDGKLKKWKKAWICTSASEYTKVWDTSGETADEYLKVSESYIGRKFVEHSKTSRQDVYTSVYWVHIVDGVKNETYLSTSQLNSFECSTLTPQISGTTVDGETVYYVSRYIIDSNAKFGEHHLKVTYKSPDTGNILKAEYSIYYLQEVGFDVGESITWYPFRDLLTDLNLGYGRLNFECTADNGDKITQSYSQPRNTSTICYDFPLIANADFKFGDNQSVGYTFVSDYTLREYTGQIVWNIRPYYHANNTAVFCGYNVRDLKLTEITINSDVEYYSKIFNPTEYTDKSDYYAQVLNNSTKASTNNVFEAPYIADYFCDHNISNIYWYAYSFPASTGYVYWGDGTFSFYASANAYQSSTTKVAGESPSKVTLQNGYKLVDGKRTAQYISPYKSPQTHTYEQSGEYTVTITSAYESSVYDSGGITQVVAEPKFLRPYYGTAGWTIGETNNPPFIAGGEITAYTPGTDLVLSGSPASSQVKEIKIGDGCFIGRYHIVKNGYFYKRYGHYSNYNTDRSEGILTITYDAGTEYLLNMTTLRLPKMSKTVTTYYRNDNSPPYAKFFNSAKSLKDIYYDGTTADFHEVFGENGKYFSEYTYRFVFFEGVGNNFTFRNDEFGATYTLNVHCIDGDITVTVD